MIDFDDHEADQASALLGLGTSRKTVVVRRSNGGRTGNQRRPSATSAQAIEQNKQDAQSAIDGHGLTFVQRKAIILMAVFDYDDKQAADELGKSVAVIKKWKRNSKFKKAINAATSSIEIDAIERRKKLNDIMVKELQESIMQDIHAGRLERLSLKEKIALLSTVTKESRSDSPQASVAVHHTHGMLEFDAIKERFNIIANRNRMLRDRKEVIDAEYNEVSDE